MLVEGRDHPIRLLKMSPCEEEVSMISGRGKSAAVTLCECARADTPLEVDDVPPYMSGIDRVFLSLRPDDVCGRGGCVAPASLRTVGGINVCTLMRERLFGRGA